MIETSQLSDLYKKIVEESPAAIVVTDSNGLICIVNAALQNIFGYQSNELIGKKVEILIPEKFRNGHVELRSNYMKNPLSRSMLAGQDLFALTKDGSKIPIQIGLSPIVISERVFIQATVIDMRERLKQEADRRNAFLEEIHHRVKNNLALITSFLQMERRRLNSLDKEIIEIFTTIENRLRVIARIHENLYQNKNYEEINLNEYFRLIAADLEASFSKKDSNFPKFSFIEKQNSLFIADKAICLGLMFNEFSTNSIKHAFKDPKLPPEITVTIEDSADKLIIIFHDNGKGIDLNQESNGSVGKKIISILSQQINAKISWSNDGGTSLTFIIPKV